MSSNGKRKDVGTSSRNRIQPNRFFDAYTSVVSLKFLLLLVGVSAFIVSIYIQIAINLSGKFSQGTSSSISQAQKEKIKCSPYHYELAKNAHDDTTIANKVLIVADNLDAGYLDHVIETFGYHDFDVTIIQSFDNLTTDYTKDSEKLDYEETDINKQDKINHDSFNVIWAYDYPFASIKRLQSSQRVNHFPGIGFIANKVTLSTTPKLPNTLRAFRLPEEADKFVEYSNANPNKQWVEKTSSHRGISITAANNVNLTPLQSTIVQEFVSNPLLIDGKKFDIGIYVAITSVNPMRAYLYDQETLIRFCAKPYYYNNDSGQKLFNSSDIDSYVVGDDYTPIWLMPSLLKYYIGTNLSMKKTLRAYLKENSVETPEVIWEQIEDTIKHALKEKEIQVAKLVKLYQQSNDYTSSSSLNQFFELLRFDFIIDDSLKVYLMEANMSPNLSSKHFPPNKFIYEQVLRSYFSLTGLTQFGARHLLQAEKDNPDGSVSYRRGLDKIVDDKELSVYDELCSSTECHMNCSNQDCKICYFCLSDGDKLHLKRAIFEQKSKWNFKRILPSTQQADFALQLNNLQLDTDQNLIHVQWFKGKCYSDSSFCS